MKIAKPILLVSTPLGVIGGLREAYKFSPGLAFLMLALVLVVGAAVGMLVMTIRREQAAARAASQSRADVEDATPPSNAPHGT